MNRFSWSLLLLLFLFSALLSQSKKLSIAVLKLDAYGITDYEAATLTDRLRNELFKTRVFRVMEREQMEEILKEQGFQQTGCTSSECLVQVGQLIGVNRMVGGSIGKVGQTYTVSLRLIDVETGEIIKIATKDVFGKIDALLTASIPQIAKDIASPSPGTQKVLQVEKDAGFSSNSQSYDPIMKTLTDINGNVYETVKIGNQIWMAENLKVTHYRDGTPIAHVTDNNEWTGLTCGAYCAYSNEQNNVAIYGLLYNWYAVDDKRSIAPIGWHVPTDEEWKKLEMYLGLNRSKVNNISFRGTNEGSKLAGNVAFWDNGNLKYNAVFGDYSFCALPGGFRYSYDGTFYCLRHCAYFWSSEETNGNHVWYRKLEYEHSGVERDFGVKQEGFSVRCVMN